MIRYFDYTITSSYGKEHIHCTIKQTPVDLSSITRVFQFGNVFAELQCDADLLGNGTDMVCPGQVILFFVHVF